MTHLAAHTSVGQIEHNKVFIEAAFRASVNVISVVLESARSAYLLESVGSMVDEVAERIGFVETKLRETMGAYPVAPQVLQADLPAVINFLAEQIDSAASAIAKVKRLRQHFGEEGSLDYLAGKVQTKLEDVVNKLSDLRTEVMEYEAEASPVVGTFTDVETLIKYLEQ